MPNSILISTGEYPPSVGGLGTASQRLARHLAALGWRVHVVVPVEAPGRSDTRTTDEDGMVVHRLWNDYMTDPRASFQLRQFVQRLDDEQNFDLFHGLFLTAAYPCLSVAERGGRRRPVIASIRGGDAHELLGHPHSRALIIPVLRKATWITSVSQTLLDRVAEDVDISGRSSVIRNGVVRMPGEPWRLDETNRGVVGTTGTGRRTKDIPVLIRGYAHVPPALRRRLRLIGFFTDLDEERWSNVLVDELGLRGEFEMTGPVPHARVAEEQRTLHVYAHSASHEGMPNALLEAATLGLPLVSTSAGALGEILTDGENALVVPPSDPPALGQAIARVLSDDTLALALSAGALRLVGELTPERERDEWLALYARLLHDK